MEHFTISKPDGMKLDTLYFAPSKPFSYLVIICHGFSGAKENRGYLFSLAEKLNNQGFAALAFDFAGSGQSDGTFDTITLSRQIEDLQTVIQYAAARFGVPLILLGRSFGGSTVIGAGSSQQVAGCILWSAAVRLEEVFHKALGSYYDQMKQGKAIHAKIMDTVMDMQPSFVADLEHFDMSAALKKLVGKPLFAIQGAADTLVTPENVETIRAYCPQAEIQFIAGADHRFEALKALREDTTMDWLTRTFQ